MIISELKEKFFASLVAMYPKEEIQSFFNILSQEYFGLSRLDIALNPKAQISLQSLNKIEDALLRLQGHEPIQYIVGNTEFYGIPFYVNKDTLIPRPETEELVDWILKENQDKDSCALKILDIGTGSGCIAISLAKNLPNFSISGLDFSKGALEIAARNAELNNVNVDFFCQDILKAENLPKQYDIIVSNPPYVRDLEKKEMQQNVLAYEPDSALFVRDQDPLIFYRIITALAKDSLKLNGVLFFEINEFLAEELIELLTSEGFRDIEVRKDIYGKNRMLKGTIFLD